MRRNLLSEYILVSTGEKGTHNARMWGSKLRCLLSHSLITTLARNIASTFKSLPPVNRRPINERKTIRIQPFQALRWTPIGPTRDVIRQIASAFVPLPAWRC